MTDIPAGALAAAQRYGPLVNELAQGYHDPYTGHPLSGTALLLKLSKGENAFQMGGNPSSAGARGATQFTPGSRDVVIQKFGIDPWRSYDEAFHAAALHLLGKVNGQQGLHGYNPGDASYTDYILRQQIGGGHGGAAASSPAGGGVPVMGVVGSQTLDAGGGAPGQPASDVTAADVLAALKPPQPVQASPIAPPFSAAQTYLQMPAGYRALPAQPPAAPSNVDAALSVASRVLGPDIGQQGLTATVPVTGVTGTTALDGTGSAGGRLGRISVAAGANLPGHPLKPEITTFARMVAGQFGQPLTVGTGTNHSKFTVNGTVSDHHSGNAVDIPATGQRLHELGLAALLAAGVPAARARQEAAQGGLFDVPWHGGRLQLIFAVNRPDTGDHTTHIHLGFAPR